MDELLEQFLIEAREQIQQASDDLMALEQDPADPSRIDSVFRAVHTLKGSVALFDFGPMGAALHAAEDLLGTVRAGQPLLNRGIIDALLDCISASDIWIDSIASNGCLPPDAEQRSVLLRAALTTPSENHGIPPATDDKTDLEWLTALLARDPKSVAEAGRPLTAIKYTPNAECFFLGDDPMALVQAIPHLVVLHLSGRKAWSETDFDPFHCNLVIEALSTAPIDEIRRIFRFVPDQAVIVEVEYSPVLPEKMADGASETASRTLRVDAARIDAMVDIVSELIVAKNSLTHLVAQAAKYDPGLARSLGTNQAEIERLVSDMHNAVMGVRMMPLDRTFRRFPRLVREMAAKLGKDVAFDFAGEEIEADKSIVDGLFEPLLHILRNALDHGIENVAARIAAGKSGIGRVTLDARRDGGQIVIAVTDNGAGIDVAKIRRIAKARAVMSDTAIDALDDDATIDLIFAPGFSTAARITDISGRGVGMDAVRIATQALGGRVAVTTELGKGSTVSLILPQAVIINTIMIVRVGEERFGIPIDAVAETTRVTTDRVLPIRDGEAFVLRDRTVPLLRLSALLGLPSQPRGAGVKVLIVAIGEQRIGIEVDGFESRLDVLLRPMIGLLSEMPGILGMTLLGDGHVLMVLNLPELVG